MFKLFRITILGLFFWACQPQPLQIESFQFCDNFNSLGDCTEPIEQNHTYKVIIPADKFPGNWDELCNYLYFHSRETPGFLLHFNRKFTPSEEKSLRRNYLAEFQFRDVSGEMEGFEIGDNWIASFQYLGSMVREFQKKEGMLQRYPFPEQVFPADLEFHYSSSEFDEKKTTRINLQLERKY